MRRFDLMVGISGGLSEVVFGIVDGQIKIWSNSEADGNSGLGSSSEFEGMALTPEAGVGFSKVISDDLVLVAQSTKPFVEILDLSKVSLKGIDKVKGLSSGLKVNSILKSYAPEKLACLTTTRDLKYIIGGSISGFIYVWDISTEFSGRMIRFWKGHLKPITCLELGYKDQYLVVGSEDCTVSVWAMGDILQDTAFSKGKDPLMSVQWNQHSLPITSIATSAVGSIVATTSLDRTCILWDLTTKTTIKIITVGEPLSTCIFDPSETEIFMAGQEGKIYHVQLSGSSKLNSFKAHTKPISCLAFNWTGSKLFSSGVDGIIKAWVREYSSDLGKKAFSFLKSFRVGEGRVSCLQNVRRENTEELVSRKSFPRKLQNFVEENVPSWNPEWLSSKVAIREIGKSSGLLGKSKARMLSWDHELNLGSKKQKSRV